MAVTPRRVIPFLPAAYLAAQAYGLVLRDLTRRGARSARPGPTRRLFGLGGPDAALVRPGLA
ncbi:hypothetical protein Ahu01nite_036540 [Winogradskya humida]|uniref:Uncharacterized protein n=1 Tax=Winogradskya humida TaxID=113566 RepID=A0ABQ3ZPM7_9ACTN|nr:hypothetical protein Ahu01nite_036540 [Actinoplanes humidus]